jgi:tetratricopeptide (TPR) repeat protein
MINQTPSTTPPPQYTFSSFYYLGVILLVLGIYLPSMHGEFLFDDIYEIEQNPHIRTLSPLSEPMLSTHTLPVRPLPYLTFALNFAAHQLDTRGYHLVNVLLHLFAGWLLFQVIFNSFTASWSRILLWLDAKEAYYLASLTAVLWLIHPVQTQAVSYIYQRIEVMVSLLLLLSIYAYQRFLTKQHFYWLWVSISACFLAMLSKESAFIIPLLILSYDWLIVIRLPENQQKEPQKWRSWFFPVLGSLWILQFLMIGAQSASYGEFSGSSHDRWQYLLTQSWVILHYLKLVIFPFPLLLDYHWPPITSLSASFPASILVAAGILLTFFAIFKRYTWGLPLIWFYLTLAPSSSFVPVIAICAEHRMYLTLAAPVLVGVCLIYWICKKIRLNHIAFSIVIIAIMAFFSCLTFQRNHSYQTRLGMWEDVRQKAPENPNCYWYLGKTYTKQGNIPSAINSYETGLTKQIIVSGNRATLQSKFHNELGLLYSKNEKTLTLAQQHYQQAFTINPGNVEAHNNLGILYFNCGYPQRAEAQFLLALQKRPDFPQAKQNLQILHEELKQKK